MSSGFPKVALSELLVPISRPEDTLFEKQYCILGAHWYAQGLYIKDVKSGSEIQADKVYRVEEGDFVYNRLFAWKGSFALALQADHDCYVSNEFPCFRIKQDRISGKYLWKYFSQSSAWDEALGLSSGGTPTSRNRLKEEKLLAMEIPLPPLQEQHRIVARIEELAGKIEEARGLRREAVEEAEVLLPAVAARAYDEAAKIAGGVERLDDICLTITDGTHVTPTYVSEGVPFLSVKDITTGTIRFDDAKFITPEEHSILTRRCKPERGDILLTKVGTTGFAKAIDVDRDFSIFVSLALLKINKKRLLPSYVEYMLNSPKLREFSRAGTRGVGNKNLVLKFIRDFPVPVPSLSEQQRIVTYLEDLKTRLDSLKQLQSETAAELDALLPSVLDKAFKGEL